MENTGFRRCWLGRSSQSGKARSVAHLGLGYAAPLCFAPVDRWHRMRVWLCVLLLLCTGSGCSERARVPSGVEAQKQLEVKRALRRLRRDERALRQATDLRRASPFVRALGPDPYRLCRVG